MALNRARVTASEKVSPARQTARLCSWHACASVRGSHSARIRLWRCSLVLNINSQTVIGKLSVSSKRSKKMPGSCAKEGGKREAQQVCVKRDTRRVRVEVGRSNGESLWEAQVDRCTSRLSMTISQHQGGTLDEVFQGFSERERLESVVYWYSI